uniref:Aminoglycoside 3'-phosphotransferase n=1 Tax=uncultured soil bacterium TaxID=164851 RepID=Q6Q224_9BACT|nr:aminoglycoside 3'-phosphotransferase [uncultured soil bacterium]
MSNELHLPTTLQPYLQHMTPEPIFDGYSGAKVWRWTGQNPTLYLKVDTDLRREKDCLMWLKDEIAVPQVVAWHKTPTAHYLLMTEITGIDATSFEHDPATCVRLMAQGLREFHAIPMANCPLDRRLDVVIDAARANVEQGLVNANDFDSQRLGRTAVDLYAELLATRPASEDLVVVHGDYCLPNIFFAGGRVSGFIDVGRAGVGDRYIDLALAVRSILYNLGDDPQWIDLFFAEYGISTSEIDWAKVEYFKLLDEFF